MKHLEIPKFETNKELLKFVFENEKTLIAQKKSAIKHSDGISLIPSLTKNSFSQKSNEININERDEIKVRIVINTTNLVDSHKDLHVNGLWDKTLSESASRLLHVQEHKTSEFDKIISSGENLKAYVEDFTWKQLGYNVAGKTQALMFDSNILKSRNPFMFEQYAKGYVTNHSVGMYYMKLVTCINDENYPVQKENWDKYEPMVVNKEAIKDNFFWAVLEAKAIEGSAVPLGSNFVTPTLEVKEHEEVVVSKSYLALKKFLNE